MDQRDFQKIVEAQIEAVYHFALRVSNDRGSAVEITRQTFHSAWSGRDQFPAPELLSAWLLKIATHLAAGRLDAGATLSFDELDETLRSQPTLVSDAEQEAPGHHAALAAEVQESCMTAVLACLSLGERLAFTAVVCLQLDAGSAAAVLDISAAALKVRLSRARKKVVDYLAPRCGLVHAMNPCICRSRVGVALDQGFIEEIAPEDLEALAARAAQLGGSQQPLRDPVVVYQQLPPPVLPAGLRERLASELADGSWDAPP